MIKPDWKIFALGFVFAALLLGGLQVRPAHYWQTHIKRLLRTLGPNFGNTTTGGDYASSDRFLAGLAINQPSETVRAELAGLRPDETLVFVAPVNDPAFTQTWLTLSYLSWPRQIAVLGCAAGQPAQQLFQPRVGARVARALFYLHAPPSRLAAESRALGPQLKIIRVPEGDDWTSYCLP